MAWDMVELFQCLALCLRSTPKALELSLQQGIWTARVWIPRSVVHETSEVNDIGDYGTVAMSADFAKHKNLIFQPPHVTVDARGLTSEQALFIVARTDARLDVSGRYSPSTASLVLNAASSLITSMTADRRFTFDAICDCENCENCEDCNPIQRHVARALNELYAELSSAAKSR